MLVDFGREIHGTVTVMLKGLSEKTIACRLRLGESVTEALTPYGERGATNDHATRDMTITSGFLSANDSNESGFRFAYLELLTPDADCDLYALTATLIFRDLPYRGSFLCNDDLVNRIFDTAAYTAHLNMQRYLWEVSNATAWSGPVI